MAVTHTAATRNALADAVLAEIGASGNMIARTVGDAEVATLPLSATAGVVTAEDLVFNAITSDTTATGGTINYFDIETSGAAEVFRFLEGDITVSSTSVGAGDTVSCSALTYTASV